jgi:hypothetical protein
MSRSTGGSFEKESLEKEMKYNIINESERKDIADEEIDLEE